MAKQTIYRRRRRILPAHDGKFFKKESGIENAFFGGSSHETFFQSQAVNRKCDHCGQEDKQAQPTEDKKDDKAVHPMEDKKDDKAVHRMEDKKEEKDVHRMEDKKEEKDVHRKEDKKEEKDVHRMEDKKDDKEAHRKAEAAGTHSVATVSSYISSLSGKGGQLPPTARQFFQDSMGADFSDVRIHTGTQAEQSAAAINAKAYTVDNNIVFAANQFNTETPEGKKLLAHELTHVLQQSGGVMRKPATPNSMLPENELEHGMGTITGHGSSKENKRNFGTSVEVQGATDANYDHGNFSTANMRTKRATGCNDCGPAACVNATGDMISVFKANPTVTLPEIPAGLTPCQQQRVQTFITTVLAPHEYRHVLAFNTYNGVVRTKFDYTGCQTPQALNEYLQPFHDTIEKQRADAANKLSDALDPFNGKIDINCTEPHVTRPPHHK